MIASIKNRVHEDIEKRSQNGAYIYSSAWLAIGLGTGFYSQFPSYFWSIFCVFVGLGLFRIGICHFTKHIDKSKHKIWSFILLFNTIMPACLLSIIFTISMLNPLFEMLYFYLLLVMFAMLSGGVVNFSPHPKLSFYYLLSLVTPTFIGAMVFSEQHYIEGTMLVLYAVFMFGLSRRLSKEYDQLITQQEQLERLNNEDSLTGVANRRAFDNNFEATWENHIRLEAPLHLLIFDIDHFKRINDTHGHAAGDMVIQNVATIIKSVFKRKSDTVARIGGEEFAVLSPLAAHSAVCEMAESCRSKISASPVLWEQERLEVTVSVGVVRCTPHQNIKALTMFKMADTCMYEAKRNGRNRVASMVLADDGKEDIRFVAHSK